MQCASTQSLIREALASFSDPNCICSIQQRNLTDCHAFTLTIKVAVSAQIGDLTLTIKAAMSAKVWILP
eukprot:1161186-Pelagomonas_calceolata.AAC.4